MAKFKFNLEKVLRARQIAVDLAQKDFNEAQEIVRQLEGAIQEMRDVKESYRLQIASTVSQDQSWANQVQQIHEFIHGQEIKIEQHIKRLVEAEKLVQKKREILLKALSEAKMIEKIKEKKRAEFVARTLNEEQKELDELVTLRARNAE